MGTAKRERQKEGRRERLAREQAEAKAAQRKRQFILMGGVAVAFVAIYAVTAFLGRNKNETGTATTGTSTSVPLPSSSTTAPAAPVAFTYGTGPCPPAQGSPQPVLTFTAAPQNCLDPSKSYTAVVETSEGTVRVKLDTVRTPGTANNFVVLSRYGYYDNTQLFRTDTSIDIIQGGSPHTQSPKDQGPGYNIPDEGGVFDFSAGGGKGPFTYKPGELVMARSQGPNSAGAQFFFTTGPKSSSLDSTGTYVVFGEVSEGLDVLQKIMALNVDSGDLGGAPSRPVTITKVTIVEDSAPPTSISQPAAPATTAASIAPAADPGVAPPGTAVIIDRNSSVPTSAP